MVVLVAAPNQRLTVLGRLRRSTMSVCLLMTTLVTLAGKPSPNRLAVLVLGEDGLLVARKYV